MLRNTSGNSPRVPDRPHTLKRNDDLHKNLKIFIDGSTPSYHVLKIVSDAAIDEGLLQTENSSYLLQDKENPPRHIPIFIGTGTDSDDYSTLIRNIEDMKHTVVTRNFIGHGNRSLTLSYLAKHEPAIRKAPYFFRSSPSGNLIPPDELEPLKKKVHSFQPTVQFKSLLSDKTRSLISTYLDDQERLAATTALYLAVNSISDFCTHGNISTRNRANRVPLTPIEWRDVFCSRCDIHLSQYHKANSTMSLLLCQWAVSASSLYPSSKHHTKNGQVLLCPPCASKMNHLLDNNPCIWAPSLFPRPSYQPTMIGGSDTGRMTEIRQWIINIPRDYKKWCPIQNSCLTSPYRGPSLHLHFSSA